MRGPDWAGQLGREGGVRAVPGNGMILVGVMGYALTLAALSATAGCEPLREG